MAFGSALIGNADMPSSIVNVATHILCTVTLPRSMSLRVQTGRPTLDEMYLQRGSATFFCLGPEPE